MPGDYLDDTHQRIAEFAEEFLDDDDERESFVDGLMERRGYQRATHWTPPAQPDGQGKPPALLRQGKKPAAAAKPGSYFRK